MSNDFQINLRNLTPNQRDSVRIVRAILDDFLDDQEWSVINLAERNLVKKEFSRDRYLFQQPHSDIPPAYLFENFNTLKYLTSIGVIHGTMFNSGWSYGMQRDRSINEMPDTTIGRYIRDADWEAGHITNILIDLGYLTEKSRVAIFCLCKKVGRYDAECDQGPHFSGEGFTLVFKSELESFLKSLVGHEPIFSDNAFYFLGEKIELKGEIQQKSLELLIKNINRIVSKEAFYDVRGFGNYQRHVKQKGKTPIHDITKKIFSKIKDELGKNGKIKESLMFVTQNGYGIFVNKSSLHFPNKNSKIIFKESAEEALEDLQLGYYRDSQPENH